MKNKRLRNTLIFIFTFSVISSILSVIGLITWKITIFGVLTYVLLTIIAYTWIYHKREFKRNLPKILEVFLALIGVNFIIISNSNSLLKSGKLILFIVLWCNWGADKQ